MDCKINEMFKRIFLCRKNYAVEKNKHAIEDLTFDSEISSSRVDKETTNKKISKENLKGQESIDNLNKTSQSKIEISKQSFSDSNSKLKDKTRDSVNTNDLPNSENKNTKSINDSGKKDIFLTPRSSKIKVARRSKESLKKLSQTYTSSFDLLSDENNLCEISNDKNFNKVSLLQEADRESTSVRSDSIDRILEKALKNNSMKKSLSSLGEKKSSEAIVNSDNENIEEDKINKNKLGNLSKFVEPTASNSTNLENNTRNESVDSSEIAESDNSIVSESDNSVVNESDNSIVKKSNNSVVNESDSYETKNLSLLKDEKEILAETSVSKSRIIKETESSDIGNRTLKDINEDSLETFILKELNNSENEEDEETEISCSVNFHDRKTFNKLLSKKLQDMLSKNVNKSNKSKKS
jgi:hypothetical protein